MCFSDKMQLVRCTEPGPASIGMAKVLVQYRSFFEHHFQLFTPRFLKLPVSNKTGCCNNDTSTIRSASILFKKSSTYSPKRNY
jgi:hypothetical protein